MALFIFKDRPQFIYWTVRLWKKKYGVPDFVRWSVAWYTDLTIFLQLLFWNLRLWKCGCEQICTGVLISP